MQGVRRMWKIGLSAVLALFLVYWIPPAEYRDRAGAQMTMSVEETQTPQTTETENSAVYQKITPQDAKAYMEEGGYTVLDVRTAGEFAQIRIPGAVNHPVEDIANISQTIPDKDTKILVYCRSGGRSRRAAEAMIAQGYTHVLDFGGILDWPYETER